MIKQKVDRVIDHAITLYLNELESQRRAINTAFRDKTAPPRLRELIKQELAEQAAKEINALLKCIYSTPEINNFDHYYQHVPYIDMVTDFHMNIDMINKLTNSIEEFKAKRIEYFYNLELSLAPPIPVYNMGLRGDTPTEQRLNLITETYTFPLELQETLLPQIYNMYRPVHHDTFTSFKYTPDATVKMADLLIKMHWARHIQGIDQHIATLKQNRDDCITKRTRLDYLLSHEESCTLRQMQGRLSPRALALYENKRLALLKDYDYNVLDTLDHQQIFAKFLAAVKPSVCHDARHTASLNECERGGKNRDEMKLKQEEMIHIIDMKLVRMKQGADPKKVHRIKELRDRIERYNVTDETTDFNLEHIIRKWQTDSYNHQRNNEAFKDGFFYKITHKEPSKKSQFIKDCLRLVTPPGHADFTISAIHPR